MAVSGESNALELHFVLGLAHDSKTLKYAVQTT